MGVSAAAELDAWLRQGGVVVAASERAARAIAAGYHRARRAESRKAWEAPNVLSWQNFVRTAWERRVSDARLVLNPLQELAIWQDVLALSGETAATLRESRRRLASQAMHAHALLASYVPQLLDDRRRSGWQQDAGAFSVWLSRFDEACPDHKAVSPARLALELVDLLGAGDEERPALLLSGFDRVLPVQERLFDAWGAWRLVEAGDAAPKAHFYAAPDLRGELNACGLWAKQRLAANGGPRLLIITQSVSEQRGQLERAFSTHCASAAVEFSLGVALATVSVARAASLLLGWLTSGIAEHELDWLFSTDFAVKNREENYALQAAMRIIRRKGRERTRWTLDAFLGEVRNPALTAWRERLTTAQAILKQQIGSFPPLAHAETTLNVLSAAGWPGNRELTSSEYQAAQRFEQAVETCGSLGFSGTRLSWTEFSAELHDALTETLFSPETQDAPILIAGPAEAAGLYADAIWFLGADEERWPSTGDLHPLLPASVQLQYQMPHASAQLDWNLAAAITNRLAVSTPEIHFSYAGQTDGIERTPSRLITQVAGAPVAVPDEFISPPVSLPRTLTMEDSAPVGLDRGSIERGFHGDSGALTAQSLCPFKGFATARLGARSWESAGMGLSAAARGQLIHAVLHSVWAGPPHGIKTLRELTAIPNLGEFVATHAALALQRIPPTICEQLPARYLQLEEERLTLLVRHWLEYEKTRMEFEVLDTESEATPTIAGLPLNLRLDRIDRLNDGTLLVIDYKTGDVTPKSWALPRPEDVQLPIYAGFALPDGEQLGGLAYAKVRAGDFCFTGHVGDAPKVLGNVANISSLKKSPLTAEMLLEWRDYLEDLARSFVAGRADVDPRDAATTCARCGLQALCRIQERPALVCEEETDD